MKYKMKADPGKFNLSCGSFTSRKESGYLIVSNKKKCTELIRTSDLNENNIIDIFISLHIVLEVSLNTLFRHLALLSIKKGVDKFEIINNVDRVNFIDKTVLFIYNSKFKFDDKITEATKYHKIISELKNFSQLRNQLLHGHSISTVFDGNENKHSSLKNNLTLEKLNTQIKSFRLILEGIRFYLDCLDTHIPDETKKMFKNTYLNDDFLPNLSILKN